MKIWRCDTESIGAIGRLESTDGAILSLVTQNGAIYAGCQGGKIKVYLSSAYFSSVLIALDLLIGLGL
jgi:hypothetical protein